MSFAATVYHVLIASPSDVAEERDIIAASLHNWNALNSTEMGIVLLPVMWETHSAPAMGDRAQEVINRQMVRSCDILIGAFWSRIGSPTGIDVSGTIEEIRWFLNQRKPVMLYYSQRAIPQDRLDVAQWTLLNDFKTDIRTKGLQETYETPGDLATKLGRQLTIMIREMRVAPTVNVKAVRKAQDDQVVEAPVSSDELRLVNYTEKSFLVCGNTVSLKSKLQELGGKWLNKGDISGWMFAKRHLSRVASSLNIPATLEERNY